MPTEVTVWDVKRGSAVSVKTPDGSYIWCDAGSGSFSREEHFSPYCSVGNPYLDLFIISHPHPEHISDLGNIPMNSIGKVVFNPYTEMFFRDLITEKKVYPDAIADPYFKFIVMQDEMKCGLIKTYRSLRGEILNVHAFCATEHMGEDRRRMDNYSVVTFLEQGNNVICIPGHIEELGWSHLKAKHQSFAELLKRTNILVASQHGRMEGWYSEFSEMCRPDLVVIQANDGLEKSFIREYESLVKRDARFQADQDARMRIMDTLSSGSIKIRLEDDSFDIDLGDRAM